MSFLKNNLFESYDYESEQRRDENEWELGPNCPEEGLKAHALLDWLRDNGDVYVRTPEQTQRLNYLKERLDQITDSDAEDLADEIEEVQNEINELEDAIDVYDIKPSGSFYDMDEFEVPEKFSGRRYAVGTEGETRESAEESVRNMIKEMGYDGFNSSFVKRHLDEDAVVSSAEDDYNNDVYDNPEAYFDDSHRELSRRQEESVEVLEQRIDRLKEKIEIYSNSDLDLEDDISEIEDLVYDLESEVDEIKDDPQGDFPDELIRAKIDDLLDDVRSDPEGYLSNMGADIHDYIDEDGFVEDVVDEDGYGHILNSYDGTADEVRVLDTTYWVFRID